MTGALVVVALLAGALLPMQAAINAQLRYAVGSPVLAALISFSVGTLSLLVYALVVRALKLHRWPRCRFWHWATGPAAMPAAGLVRWQTWPACRGAAHCVRKCPRPLRA